MADLIYHAAMRRLLFEWLYFEHRMRALERGPYG